jgi:S-adenosylmethionine hydrolase
VDPGVGGPRRDLLIESQKGLYIGPDNGLLLPAAMRDGIKQVYSIENPRFKRSPVSSTFHGRDVFAYTAGTIAGGADPTEAGPKISDPVRAAFPEPVASRGRIESGDGGAGLAWVSSLYRSADRRCGKVHLRLPPSTSPLQLRLWRG